jgi:hypothetical protein
VHYAQGRCTKKERSEWMNFQTGPQPNSENKPTFAKNGKILIVT